MFCARLGTDHDPKKTRNASLNYLASKAKKKDSMHRLDAKASKNYGFKLSDQGYFILRNMVT
jgi:hypothetical protein